MQPQEKPATTILDTAEANRIIKSIRDFDAQLASRDKLLKQIAEIEDIAKNHKTNLAKLYALVKIEEEGLLAQKQEIATAFEAAKDSFIAPLHRNAKKKAEKFSPKEPVVAPEDASTSSQ